MSKEQHGQLIEIGKLGRMQMKIEYILVLKAKIVESKIQDVLQNCFNDVKKDTFIIRYKRSNYEVNYKYGSCKVDASSKSNNPYYLTFSFGTLKNMRTASVLDYIHQSFTNAGKKKFNIIVSYDERSLYFCSKAYPYFSEFESKLRCLILKLLTQTFGIFWAQKTLTPDQIKMLKEKMHGASFEKIASEALFEMDYSTLEAYLFEETREISAEDIVDKYLNSDSLSTLDINKIKEILDSARPKSNWERYFSHKVTIKDLKAKLTIIREERNKVAHIKHYSKTDYIQDTKILCGFNEKLNDAICSIEDSELTPQKVINTIVAFGLFLASLSFINSSMQQAIKVSETIENLSTPKIPVINTTVQKALKAAQENIPRTDTPAQRALKAIQASVPKADPSVQRSLKAIQASISRSDTTALKFAQSSIPKIPASATRVLKADIPRIDSREIQRLRLSVLKNDKAKKD